MKRVRALPLAIFLVLSLVASACSTAAPTSTQAPAAPTKGAENPKSASTPGSATPQTAATPAKPEAQAAKSGQGTDWKADWDQTVAAAKKEGKVVVVGSAGDSYRNAALAFQKSYPDIEVDFSGMKGPEFAPRVLAERSGGQYLWDVYFGGSQTAFNQLIPNGVLDPVKPILVLPEVLDDSKWFLGFDRAWMDIARQYIFGFEAGLQINIFVNRDLVPEAELNNHDQLLDPKWKGKIVSGDPRTAGAQNGITSWFLKVKGEDWLRKFYSQDIAIMTDERAELESAVRGRYPIMVGVNAANFQLLAKEGLTRNLIPLDPDSEMGAFLSTGSSHATLINRAPHPNAAKVFINWLLSKEGQEAYVEATNVLSRRTDVVGGDQTFKPRPGINYSDGNHEDKLPYSRRAMEIAKEIFK